MVSPTRRVMTLATMMLALAAAGTVRSQPLDARTVNLEGTWTPEAHDLHFAFAHRFEIAGENEGFGDILDDGKVVNYPTFALTYGIAPRISIGTRYSTNSLIADRANEWQPFLKVAPVKDAGGVSLSLLGAYNTVNESWDGEASAQFARGPLTLIGAVRGFSSPLAREADDDEAEFAIGAGGSVALNRYLSLNADYANMVSQADAQVGWSAGLTARIPYTPHTLAFYATNVSSGTLEGASVGIDDAVLWGFEFTVPFSGHRWGRLFDPDEEPANTPVPPAPSAGGVSLPPAGSIVDVSIKDLKFDGAEIRVPVGATVRWTNLDPLAHTATSIEGAWDSGLIEPGGTYEKTFDQPGRHEYVCTPHPFMKAAVVVEVGETGA
ncbi:MAG: plastocyanin/azurin family copper-binding protein [Gemmatimonadota bacterium]